MENLHGCDLQGTWNRIKSVRILRVNLGAKYARHRLPVEWKLGKHGPGASKDCQDQLWSVGGNTATLSRLEVLSTLELF